jgi:hypothetical protein
MATLTLAQKQAIKADILAQPDLNAVPLTTDGAYEIARLYGLPPAVGMTVWKTNASVTDILDAIDFSKYTPVDAPEITGIYAARAWAINIKQMNLQTMLQGRDTINAAKATIRASLRDAVIALPSGASGVNVASGGASGATVLTACTRAANRIEKLLTTGPQTTGATTADVMGFEGTLTYNDIIDSRAS